MLESSQDNLGRDWCPFVFRSLWKCIMQINSYLCYAIPFPQGRLYNSSIALPFRRQDNNNKKLPEQITKPPDYFHAKRKQFLNAIGVSTHAQRRRKTKLDSIQAKYINTLHNLGQITLSWCPWSSFWCILSTFTLCHAAYSMYPTSYHHVSIWLSYIITKIRVNTVQNFERERPYYNFYFSIWLKLF